MSKKPARKKTGKNAGGSAGDRNVKRVAKLDTATISDALDKLRIPGQCLGIKPRDHAFRLAGRAYTILYGPLDAEKPVRWEISSTSWVRAMWWSLTMADVRMQQCGEIS